MEENLNTDDTILHACHNFTAAGDCTGIRQHFWVCVQLHAAVLLPFPLGLRTAKTHTLYLELGC